MVKIRLQREGKKKAPFYQGTYNPMTEPSTIVLDQEKVAQWIKNGAKPTDTVKKLIENAAK